MKRRHLTANVLESCRASPAARTTHRRQKHAAEAPLREMIMPMVIGELLEAHSEAERCVSDVVAAMMQERVSKR